MTIDTDRLALRRFTSFDLDALAEILADPQVMQFSLAGPKTRAQTQDLLENILESYEQRGWGLYAVVSQDDRALIGFCGLMAQVIDRQPEVEIGYRLAPAYWGRGLATEAACTVRDYGFRLGFQRLISIIQPENTRSIRVAEKVGLRHEKDATFHGLSVRIYAITNPAAVDQTGIPESAGSQSAVPEFL